MLKGLIILLLFQLLGEAVVSLCHLPVPGAVIGMLLLFCALFFKRGASAELQRASQTLIQYLSLFLIPAGVGLFFLPLGIRQHWFAILMALTVGTLIAMLLSAWLIKRLASSKA